jgi:hypothetical protein
MGESDERRRAAEALATVQAHQERTRRAARPRWWAYVIIFLVVAAAGAVTDVVPLSGERILAGVVAVLVVAVIVARFCGWNPMSRLRGVQGRREVDARRYGLAIVVGFLGFWVVFHYAPGWADGIAGATGLTGLHGTVSGVLTGALFACWAAVVGELGARAQR